MSNRSKRNTLAAHKKADLALAKAAKRRAKREEKRARRRDKAHTIAYSENAREGA